MSMYSAAAAALSGEKHRKPVKNITKIDPLNPKCEYHRKPTQAAEQAAESRAFLQSKARGGTFTPSKGSNYGSKKK